MSDDRHHDERRYFLLCATNLNDLQEMVERNIDEGWTPMGGVEVYEYEEREVREGIAMERNEVRFFQAIYRPVTSIHGSPIRFGTFDDFTIPIDTDQAAELLKYQPSLDDDLVHFVTSDKSVRSPSPPWGPICEVETDGVSYSSATIRGTNCAACLEAYRDVHLRMARRAEDRLVELVADE